MDPNSYGAGSYWEKNWTSADKAIFIGWKFGGASTTDVDASHALTFMLSCMKCDATGWVAIGINPTVGRDVQQMEGTSAIVWKIDEDSVREYDIGPPQSNSRKKGIVPWGSRNHIDRIAIDVDNRHATFSIGVGVNPNFEWRIASALVDNRNESTVVTYAYSLSGGWAAQHSARGVVPLKLRPPAHDPVAAATTATPTIDADTSVALATLLAILGAVAVNVLLLAIAVGTVLVIIAVLKRSRAEHHAEMAHNIAAGATVSDKAKPSSSGRYHDLANGAAPALPARPTVELTPVHAETLHSPDFRASDLTRILTDDLDSSQRPARGSTAAFDTFSPARSLDVHAL